ncbi:hypothetical protein T11_6555 [Trichinella zimbabwensis]|uniref:Uncharacterized protein n=2 Tax=Trichinella zimbabwensis TaxID=268475 RepID=A0A0V1GHR7_9BILA|nr:hypothetical protein T11_6555 [Trichinella zimbabwensis]
MSFLALFRGESSTIWVSTGRFSRKLSEMSFLALFRVNQAQFGERSTIWVIPGRFSRKFYEMLFFALFRVNQARFG